MEDTIEIESEDEGYRVLTLNITINGLEIEEMRVEDLEGYFIIDIERSDAFRELMVAEWGPSDDPRGIIFTYHDTVAKGTGTT